MIEHGDLRGSFTNEICEIETMLNHPKVVENQGDIWLQIFQDFDISLMRQQLMCSS